MISFTSKTTILKACNYCDLRILGGNRPPKPQISKELNGSPLSGPKISIEPLNLLLYLNLYLNFEKSVLGCIDTYRGVQRRIFQHFASSTRRIQTRRPKSPKITFFSARPKMPPRGRLCSLYRLSTLSVKYERSKPGRKITSNFQDCHTHLHLPSKRYLSDILHIERRSELKTKFKNSSISQSYDRNNFPYCKMT